MGLLYVDEREEGGVHLCKVLSELYDLLYVMSHCIDGLIEDISYVFGIRFIFKFQLNCNLRIIVLIFFETFPTTTRVSALQKNHIAATV